jgi:hypothetical protein
MAAKREGAEPHAGEKRMQRRDARGRFSESRDRGKAAAQDQALESDEEPHPHDGDRRDRSDH